MQSQVAPDLGLRPEMLQKQRQHLEAFPHARSSMASPGVERLFPLC